ncbi:hypothetical protein [Lysobacter gummosus]|uniref:hypothetical protein n=1 Tax=Lysobacter gummosus TaxID=262324 RepID=UPI003635F46F
MRCMRDWPQRSDPRRCIGARHKGASAPLFVYGAVVSCRRDASGDRGTALAMQP